MDTGLAAFCRRYEKWIVCLLILLGAALRLAAIGRFPPGLNQDEASAGYEAWALLHYGMDRNGHAWPVLLTAWGSGQNALYSYLSLPFVALLGLNTLSLRLTAGLCGAASLPLFYGLARRAAGRRFALWALLVLALNPWHVLLSRWALESNLLPFTLLLGVYCLVRSGERQWWLLGAGAAFGLAVYAYGTAFVFLPLFLLPASVILLRRRGVTLRCYALSAALFFLLALPVTLCNVRNVLGLGEMRLLWMTLPALNETRQASTTVFGGSRAWTNFAGFLRLLWRQSDGLPWNSAGAYGLIYGKAGLALALLGLGQYICRLLRGRGASEEIWPLLALIVSFLAAFLIDGNVNRMNMAFLPILWFQAAGLCLLGRSWLTPLLVAAAVLAGGLFARFYFTGYAESLRTPFYDGLGEAIVYAGEESEDAVWVSWDVNMPYIYVLFYEQIPPEEYRATVEYMNPGGAFEWVSRFGRWRFGREAPEDGTLCVLRREQAGDMEVLACFSGFAVARYPAGAAG